MTKETYKINRDPQANIPLPVQPQDCDRVDEKYRYRHGYSDLDRAFGVDWNSQDERWGK